MKNLLKFLLVLLFLIFSSSFLFTHAVFATDWPQYRLDQLHSGFNSTEVTLSTSNVSQLVVDWTFPTGGGVSSSPSVVNNIVYIPSENGTLYALNAITGSLIWQFNTRATIHSSPAIASNIVYINSQDGNLYALNATNGNFIWSAATNNFQDGASPTISNSVVYIGTQDGHVDAFDGQTGNLIWKTNLNGEVDSTPAISNGILYIGAANGFYALDTSTGNILWTDTTLATGDTASVSNNTVYLALGNQLYAVDGITGSVIWSSPTGGVNFSAPAVANGIVYIGSLDNNLYAFNATTGAQIWASPADSYIDNPSPAVANGVVYIAARDGGVYGFNALTGQRLWKYTTGSNIFSSPTIVNGIVYIGSQDNNLYAFHLVNHAPVVGSISVSTNPVQVNIPITASANFADQDTSDTHTAQWDWGDGNQSPICPPNVTECSLTESNGSGTVSGNHTYSSPGVYTITLQVTDNHSASGISTFQYVSVYNPTPQGLFSGARIFTSPAGAYSQNTSLTGKVMFGVSIKYSGTVPDGKVEMNFKDANLDFIATSITSFVTSNGMATVTGSGTVNGTSGYSFFSTGLDSSQGGPDIRFQIKDPSSNVFYDSQPGAAETATPTASVTGNVVVH